MGTDGNSRYKYYGIRMTPELWRRFQAYVQRENKRIGREQVVQDVLRQALDLGLQQLEKK